MHSNNMNKDNMPGVGKQWRHAPTMERLRPNHTLQIWSHGQLKKSISADKVRTKEDPTLLRICRNIIATKVFQAPIEICQKEVRHSAYSWINMPRCVSPLE